MTRPDFEAMTATELQLYRSGLKDQIAALREDALAAGAAQNRKLMEGATEEARRQLARVASETGSDSDAVARLWLTSDQQGRRIQARLHLGLPREGREPVQEVE